MSTIYYHSAGVIAPGMTNLEEALSIFLGQKNYEYLPLKIPTPELLPPTERRRSTRTVKIALSAASQALAGCSIDVKDLNLVFGSSDGDGDITDSICRAIWESSDSVSPTKFSNSVHNAPAGYFSIATGDMRPSISICAYDRTFEMSLLETIAQIEVEKKAVLLVVYDVPYNKPLYFNNMKDNPLAVAFVLSPEKLGSNVAMKVNISPSSVETNVDDTIPGLGSGLENALVLLKSLLQIANGKITESNIRFSATETLQIEIIISES